MADGLARFTREQRQLAELLLRQRGLDPAQLPIARRIDPGIAPLSWTQRRLWTSGQSTRGTAYGNVPMAVRVRGPLNLGLVEGALSLIVERHEILRTTFALENGSPVQRIHPSAPVAWRVEDLRNDDAPESRERRLASAVEQEARRPFDPSQETLFRAMAFRLADAEWGLLLVSHHLATDGWGARLLLDELASAYRSLAEGQAPALPRLGVQYGDFAAWEEEHIAAGALESQRRHWLERLADAPRQLALPSLRTGSGSVETKSVPVSLSPGLADQLRTLARARGVTPYIVLLSGLEVVLRQATGQDDIVVGTILSRRTRSETEPLIGNFGNNLLLRTKLDDDPSFAEIVDRTAETMRDALAHSDVPLELVAQSAPIPAFQMMFLLRDGGLEERLALPGTVVEPMRATSGAATLDLIVDLTDGVRGIGGYFEYQTSRFPPQTIQQLASAFADFTTRLVREPSTRLSALPALRIDRVDDRAEQVRVPGELPVTRTERILARLWSRMLDGTTVYRSDNFFRLGGDSLGAVYVLERAEKELGHRFRPDELNSATLADLADACDRGDAIAPAASPTAVPATIRRVDPLRYGDQIKDLFEREEMSHLSEFFDRSYADAVRDGATSWVMLGDGDRVVGHVAVFRHRFRCGEAEYVGGLGVNLVVDRRHRTLTGALALAERMVRDLERDGDMDFLYGDPNEEGRAIMSTIPGFRDIDVLTRFVLPIDEPGVLGPIVSLYLTLRLGRADTGALGMERRPAAHFDTAQVERPPGGDAVLRPSRSPALYPRRLAGYPAEHDTWYLFTRESVRVAAVLVRALRGGRAHLSCLWRRPDVGAAELLRPMIADLRERGVTRLQLSVLRASPLAQELRGTGFREREQGSRFGAIPCSPRGRTLLDGGSEWEITDIDCDRGVDDES